VTKAWTAGASVSKAIPGGRWWSRLTAADDDVHVGRSSSQAAPTAALVIPTHVGSLIFAIVVLTTTLVMLFAGSPACPGDRSDPDPLELDTYHARRMRRCRPCTSITGNRSNAADVWQG